MNRSGLPWCILYSQKLTPSEKLVFMTLKDRAYQQDKTCESGFYCYIDWLCANLNMSENTVRKALNGLREKKLINSKRVKVHKNVVNMWFIDWAIIDKASKQFKFKDSDYTEVDVLEEVKEQPIEQLPNLSPKENDTDLDEMNFKEIDFNENPELSFLNEDDDMPTIDKFINRLSKLEYQSTAYWNEMKKIMSEVPSGMKSFYNEEISRIMKKQAA